MHTKRCPDCGELVETIFVHVDGCPGDAVEAVVYSEFYVWWLTPEDYHGFEPHQDRNPLRIPDYAWDQFRCLCGRAGRGRLWVPDHIEIDSLPVDENDPRWTDTLLRAGGIVIEARHAADCARWGGVITTLTLDPVDQEGAR